MTHVESVTQAGHAPVAEGNEAAAPAVGVTRPGAAVHTGFDPARHGWSLPNRFLWGPGKRWTYGLCGGLCYAALDHWAAGLPIPLDQDPAHLRPSLRAYLRRRQLASMAPRHLAALARWLLMANASAEQRVFAHTVPPLCAALDSGRPTPLMLIRTRGLVRPWDNHQVVAHGYWRNPATGALHVQVYDPNHPRQTVEITLDPPGEAGSHRLSQSTGEPLRGLFPIGYRPMCPPIASSDHG